MHDSIKLTETGHELYRQFVIRFLWTVQLIKSCTFHMNSVITLTYANQASQPWPVLCSITE